MNSHTTNVVSVNPAFERYFLPERLASARIVNGIPRFTPDESYSTGNFSLLREKHATLQLDSQNGTTDRRDTILQRTNWPPSFFEGKTVLECGCGVGPDTEALLSFGAKVLSVDLAGLDIAKRNIGDNPNAQFVQASIMDLPLKPQSFDIVYCHRVIQHTPDPEQTLRHILDFVKPEGAAFVHSYAHTFYNLFCWKYLIRPVTRRLNPEFLYKIIKAYAKPAYHFTNFTYRFGRVGKRFNFVFVPFYNNRNAKKFEGKDDDFILEFGIHDTFDALSPRYDQPLRASVMRAIAEEKLSQPFEVAEFVGITLLRSVVQTD